MMFAVRQETRFRLRQIEQELDGRDERRKRFEHVVSVPLAISSRDGFYRKVAYRLAGKVKRKFRCETQVIESTTRDVDGWSTPVYKVVLTFP